MASDLEAVRARFVEVNGEHPMSEADDLHVRVHCEPVTDPRVLAAMAEGRLPPPAYLLADGTPMARPGHADVVEWAGGFDHLRDWFAQHWDGDAGPVADQEWERYLAGGYGDLRSATPAAIRRWRALADQADTARRALDRDPRDPLARGSLHEAVEGLDRLLAPTTDYDRLRFGGATTRDRSVDDLRGRYLSPADPELPVRTERLVLRRREARDTDALHAIYGRADVAAYLLFPPLTRLDLEDRHRRQAENPGDALGLVVELEGRVIGDVVLMFRGPSQSEAGWTFHPDVAGRGYATEASRALLDLAFGHYGHHRVYAELDARNTASARLCERLRMRREAHRLRDYWSKGEWTDSLQYAVLAEEWRANA